MSTPDSPAVSAAQATRDETRGMWLGVLGVLCFGITLPMTRLATGTSADPQLSPWFVTLARAALAGGLSIIFLLSTRSPRPQRQHWKALALAALSTTIGYPLLLGYALRVVTASHAAVITALMPLATAMIAAWVLHQRARLGFWLCAVAGSILVVIFSVLRARQGGHALGFEWADLLLLGAVLAGSVGYIYGAQITPALGAERVICWVCVIALPYTLPGALLLWPEHSVQPSAWGGLLYVGVVSMWAGFFAWFRGLALGGALRVSQVQLLQPFFSILAAVVLLGEALDAVTLAFAAAVVGTVLLGKRLSRPVPAPHPATAQDTGTATATSASASAASRAN